MLFAVDKHRDKIAAGFAINEGGGVFLKDGKPQYIGLQVSEKVPANVDVIAKGTSGHASMPRKDNPVVHLAAAIEKIGSYEAPVQFNSVTRAYFQALAPLQDEETSKWMRSLDTSDRGEHAARVISNQSPAWNAMLHDTATPTMLRAGIRANVIPSEARATINVRLLPGDQLAPLLAKLQQLVNDPTIAVRTAVALIRNGSVLFAHLRFLQHDFQRHRQKLSRRALSFRSCPRISPIPLRCAFAMYRPTD